jgi:hypothetical protein
MADATSGRASDLIFGSGRGPKAEQIFIRRRIYLRVIARCRCMLSRAVWGGQNQRVWRPENHFQLQNHLLL